MKKILVLTLLINCFMIQAQCWLKVETGMESSFAIAIDSSLWAWGYANGTQLGNMPNQDENKPVLIDNGKWIAISGGWGSTMGVKKDGTLWGWGDNSQYQLGIASNTNSAITPTQVGTATNWKEVYMFGGSSFGIKNDGTLWGWGENTNGQLGDGTTIDRTSPFQLGTANNWKSLAIGGGGGEFVIAIKTDGTLWSWGNNSDGQLGIGNNTNTFTPTQVGTDNKWAQVSASRLYAIGLKTDGTLWGWGKNSYGNLGTSNTTSYNAPTQIGVQNDWASICSMIENNFVLAIKSNGTLWAWGNNITGAYGNGTTISNNFPTQIGTSTNWKSAAVCDGGSSAYSIAIKTDNTLWAWGANFYGQLGNGTNTSTNTPIQINCPSINVNELNKHQVNFSIYPSPASEVICIEGNIVEVVKVEIYNELGQQIKLVDKKELEKKKINISDIKSPYINLVITTNTGEMHIKKVLIQK